MSFAYVSMHKAERPALLNKAPWGIDGEPSTEQLLSLINAEGDAYNDFFLVSNVHLLCILMSD